MLYVSDILNTDVFFTFDYLGITFRSVGKEEDVVFPCMHLVRSKWRFMTCKLMLPDSFALMKLQLFACISLSIWI